MTEANSTNIVKLEHHEQQDLCRTRPLYRQGRKLTAVKVYTVNDESQHLIVSGVPKLKLIEELRRIVMPYGVIKELAIIPDYPNEEFTESFHVRYERIQSARIAKRFVDGKNFYGGLLHVFYAPELESVAETRKKLMQRRRDVGVRLKRQQHDAINLKTVVFEPREQFHRQKKYPALPLTEGRLAQQYPQESATTIYNGIPREIDPRPVSEPSLPSPYYFNSTTGEQSTDTATNSTKTPWINARDDGRGIKRKNYKGRTIDNANKIHVVRPQLIDTKRLATFNSKPETKIFPVVKKIENGIIIKLLPKVNDEKKRIILKDQSSTQLVRPSENLQSSIETAKSLIREAMMKNN